MLTPTRHPEAHDHDAWGRVIKDDFIRLFCGQRLGGGVARQVYEFIGQPSLAIKVELTEGTFQNILEWQIWHRLQFTQYASLFAPCRRISPCGHVLIQERVEAFAPGLTVPAGLPTFMGDVKSENFGSLKGRVVCHDYALCSFAIDDYSNQAH